MDEATFMALLLRRGGAVAEECLGIVADHGGARDDETAEEIVRAGRRHLSGWPGGGEGSFGIAEASLAAIAGPRSIPKEVRSAACRCCSRFSSSPPATRRCRRRSDRPTAGRRATPIVSTDWRERIWRSASGSRSAR